MAAILGKNLQVFRNFMENFRAHLSKFLLKFQKTYKEKFGHRFQVGKSNLKFEQNLLKMLRKFG